MMPMQVANQMRRGEPGQVRESVYMRAYDVYCALWGPQEAMVRDGCRGGFGAGEVIAMLYAHTFPREEWRLRFEEALQGLKA